MGRGVTLRHQICHNSITCRGRWVAPAFLWIVPAAQAKRAQEKRSARRGHGSRIPPSQNHLGPRSRAPHAPTPLLPTEAPTAKPGGVQEIGGVRAEWQEAAGEFAWPETEDVEWDFLRRVIVHERDNPAPTPSSRFVSSERRSPRDCNGTLRALKNFSCV
jgi:hypothetical protein